MTEKAKAPRPTEDVNENGDTIYKSSDGRTYKTLSGAWKRNRKLFKEEHTIDTTKGNSLRTETSWVDEVPSLDPVETTEAVDVPTDVEEERREPTSGRFDWSTFEAPQEDKKDAPEVVPAVLKAVLPSNANPRQMSKEDLERAQKTSAAVLVLGYKLADKIMTRYRQAVCEDDVIIHHTEADYRWISSITNDALLDRGVLISASLTPSVVAVMCNGYWFGKPLAEIQAKRKAKLFKRETVSKIPIVGWFMRRRARKEAEKNVPAQPIV